MAPEASMCLGISQRWSGEMVRVRAKQVSHARQVILVIVVVLTASALGVGGGGRDVAAVDAARVIVVEGDGLLDGDGRVVPALDLLLGAGGVGSGLPHLVALLRLGFLTLFSFHLWG